ncbi:MAG: hypothetical protein J5792_03160 [Bacteroidales bacterium]|nr:hypothetical protein [Bacteroidales bacterium]
MMNKKLVLTLLALVLGASAVFGQTEKRPRPFELGIFASPSLNWMRSTTDGYNNKGLSFCGSYGLNMNINLFQASSNYYFLTGLNIRHLRGKLTYSAFDYNKDSVNLFPFKSKYTMTYLSIPTALKLQTNPFNDRYIIYSVFGLDNSICVSSNRKDIVKDVTYNPKNNQKNTAMFREALIVSIGMEYVLHDNTRLTAGLMLNNGFTNLFNKEFYDMNTFKNTGKKERVNIQNRTLELQLGLIF